MSKPVKTVVAVSLCILRDLLDIVGIHVHVYVFGFVIHIHVKCT
jgi:hypothetical protein